MRVGVAVVLVGVLGGCTSVKMVQRDGCWIRRTEKRLIGSVQEEIGPCASPATAIAANDPVTEMAQECIARADHRWQMRALAAWDRREPWPAQLTESNVLQECMDESTRGVRTEAAALKEKNAALERRVDELLKEQQALKQRGAEERDALVRQAEEQRASLLRQADEERKALFTRSDEERKELLAMQSRLGDHLGEAAKKVQPPPPPAIATATATSEGRGTSEQASDSQTLPASLSVLPQASMSAACPAPAPAAAPPARQARALRKARDQRKQPISPANLPACDPAKKPGTRVQGAGAAAAPANGATTAPAAASGSSTPQSPVVEAAPRPPAADAASTR